MSKEYNEKDAEWMCSRFISIGFYAFVDINKVNSQNGKFDEYIEWRDIKDIPKKVKDHNEILRFALETLR